MDWRISRRSHAALVRTIALAMALVTAACGGDGGVPPSPTPLPSPTPSPSLAASAERVIAPTTANPAAGDVSFNNVAINPDPAIAAKGRLFVFLPGTGGTPAGTERILRVGVRRGYHTIDLAYPDALAVGQACREDPARDCSNRMREEILTGQPLSPHVAVDAANSVVQRLTDLLGYLARTYPAEGWGRFLRNGAVDWSLVTAAGHSQGAGHAAYLGKLYALDRVAMFSGVADLGPDRATADWLFRAGATAPARFYAFGHLRDPVVPLLVQRGSWHALGMDAFGAAVSVDGTVPPFANTHELTTDAEPGAQAPADARESIYHSVPITDVATPLAADGSPRFAPAWVYLAFP